jgi:hypothetical protein
MGVLNKEAGLDERLAILEKLLVDNAWVIIAGVGIHDGLYCNGLKSISVHNNEERFILSVMHDNKVLKKFYDIEDVLSDALLTYFIQEYYEV